MALGIDELLESALGPWGLVLGVGVGALVASRKRLLPAVARTAGRGVAQMEHLTSSAAQGTRASLQPLAPIGTGIAGGTAAVGAFANRARTMSVKSSGEALVMGVSRAWSDLYSEARAEFEARHPATASPEARTGERSDDISAKSEGLRDAHGRFIKRDPAESNGTAVSEASESV